MLSEAYEVLGRDRCAGCGRRGSMLCSSCRARIPAPVELAPIPGVARVIARWDYDGAARNLILALKLRARRAAAEPLIAGMWEAVVGAGLAGSIVTWVPGRNSERRARGFDHAELLARGLAARVG